MTELALLAWAQVSHKDVGVGELVLFPSSAMWWCVQRKDALVPYPSLPAAVGRDDSGPFQLQH